MRNLFTATLVLFATLLAAGNTLQPGTAVPGISGKNLNNTPVQLPQAALGKVAILAFGFSEDAGEPVRNWANWAGRELPNVAFYQVPVLEGVPRLFRGLATSGIRKSIPEPQRERVVLLFQEEKLWRQRLSVSDEKTAYLVVLDGAGRVVESFTGNPGDSMYSRVKAAVEKAQLVTRSE